MLVPLAAEADDIFASAKRGDRFAVRHYLRKYPGSKAATDGSSYTPLHWACHHDRPDMVRLLLDRDGKRPAEMAFERPDSIELDPARLDDYAGRYVLDDRSEVKVWREGERLGLIEFAPDEIYPMAEDVFFCRQEPWTVRFSRNHSAAYWRLATDWAAFLASDREEYRDVERPAEEWRCLKCHVTGAQEIEAQFAESFRQEEGVGCEACHGPGSDYSDPQIMVDRGLFLGHGGRIPTEATSKGCHEDDGFHFDERLPRIAHPHPAASAAEG